MTTLQIIPNFQNVKLVNKDGTPTASAQLMFTQLFTQLQNYLSNEGLKVPLQTTANISELNIDKSTGALLYDQQTHELKVNINGEFKTVQTS
jgi:hypothetical protein